MIALTGCFRDAAEQLGDVYLEHLQGKRHIAGLAEGSRRVRSG